MTNAGMMNQMIMCVNAMKQAIEADAIYAQKLAAGKRARKDGRADWAAAAYYFSVIMGEESHINAEDLKTLYHECTSKFYV